jgi:hypothetical protein
MSRIRRRKSKNNTSQKQSMGKIAHKKTTIDGITFDSKMEANYYEYLKEQKELGEVLDFSIQPEFILQPKYFVYDSKIISYEDHSKDIYNEYDKLRKKHNKNNPNNKINIVNAIKYRADFDITYKDGSRKVVDTKGIKTVDFKIKEKMLNFRYPLMDFECIIWNDKEKAWVNFDTYQKSKKASKIKKQ